MIEILNTKYYIRDTKKGFTRTPTFFSFFLRNLNTGSRFGVAGNKYGPSKNRVKNACAKRKLVCGFTLIEILAVVAILIILSVISIQVFNRYKERQSLDLNAQMIAESLREARAQTLDSLESSSYGVHLATSTVTLFKGVSYDSLDPENKTRGLIQPVVIASSSISGDVVIFERLTGATLNSGSLFIGVSGKEIPVKEIIVEPTGIVYVEG
jgi:prepilin-type N-terminal cleavage/methylation domain-containing protein